MNILLIVPYSSTRPFGGPEGVAYDTIEGFKKKHDILAQNDLTISVLSPTHSNEKPSDGDQVFSNITIQYMKKIRPTSLTNDPHFAFSLLKKKAEIDLVHSHSPHAAFIATRLGIPTIFTIHGMFWKEAQLSRKTYLKLIYKLHTLRFFYTLGRLEKLIAISPYVVDELRENMPYSADNTELIENPVSDIFFNVKKNETEGLIFSPGVISPRKNQIEQIKAMNVLKKSGYDCKLIFTGQIADPTYLHQLRETIRDLDLEKNVVIAGEVSFQRLLQYYSEASIITLSSKQETAPMVISEGMATGTPVVAPEIGGVPYMINDSNDGFLVNPTDHENIAEKLIPLIDDRNLRKKIGENARKKAGERWKNELIVQKLIDMYLICGH